MTILTYSFTLKGLFMFFQLFCERTKKNNGFTLIELLIVVTIIAILGAIAIPTYLGTLEKTRKANLVRAAKSAETDLSHWLVSALKGMNAANPLSTLREVDTNWDGAVTGADMTNNTLFIQNNDAALSVANQYVTARTTNAAAISGTEFSPWNGLDACTGGAGLLFASTPNIAGNTPGNACRVTLSAQAPPPGGMTGISIRVIATSNGPGGSNSASAELLHSALITAE